MTNLLPLSPILDLLSSRSSELPLLTVDFISVMPLSISTNQTFTRLPAINMQVLFYHLYFSASRQSARKFSRIVIEFIMI